MKCYIGIISVRLHIILCALIYTNTTYPMLCREPPPRILATTFVSLWLEDASVDFME
jgi:hypothetical protein